MPVEPIKLKFAHPIPPMSVFHREIFVPWVEEVKERTTAIGKPVEITIYPAESLGKEEDQYNLVVTGMADIAKHHPASTPGKFPLSLVINLPFLFPSAIVASQVKQELFDTWAEFRDEYAETKVLWFYTNAPHHFLVRTKQVKTLEDLKGLKLWSDSDIRSETLKALGAVPVFMAIPEVYMALERGLLDAGVLAWSGTVAFKWHEVTKYRTAFPQGIDLAPFVIPTNWDTFNGLPPDVQKIFEETTGPNMTKSAAEAFDRADASCLGVIKEYDQKVGNPEIYTLPEGEFQRWKEAAAPVYEEWVADAEAMGLPGRAILEDAQRLIEKYSK